MKRGRNQRRRQGVNPNRALDSNGPDVRIRGTANQIYDKYQNLARDASSAGDRVKAENYLQHAEHYFRMIRVTQANQQPQGNAQQGAGDGDQPNVDDENEQHSSRNRQRPPRRNGSAEKSENESENNSPGDAEPEKTEAESSEDNEEPKPKRRRAKRTSKAVKENADEESGKETAPAE